MALFSLSLLAGAGLGVFYFGGLWLTVRRLPTAQYPALLTLASFFGRTVLTLLGFYLVMGGQLERLVACLLGFVVVRIILVRRWGPRRQSSAPLGR